MFTKMGKELASAVSSTSSNIQQIHDAGEYKAALKDLGSEMAGIIQEHAIRYITDNIVEQITKQQMYRTLLAKEAGQPGLGQTLQQCMEAGKKLATATDIYNATPKDKNIWPNHLKLQVFPYGEMHVLATLPQRNWDNICDTSLVCETHRIPLFFTSNEENGFIVGPDYVIAKRFEQIIQLADNTLKDPNSRSKLLPLSAESIEHRLKQLEAEEKGEGEEGKGGTL